MSLHVSSVVQLTKVYNGIVIFSSSSHVVAEGSQRWSLQAPSVEQNCTMSPARYTDLAQAAFTYPAIDNHTHPLLTAKHKDDFPFEGLLSEATGDALTEDAIHTLACYRATNQLSKLLECSDEWEAVKKRRTEMDYDELCERCMKSTGIQCFLLDDGLDGESLTESISWHDRWSSSPSKRIVRVEILAQVSHSSLRTSLRQTDSLLY